MKTFSQKDVIDADTNGSQEDIQVEPEVGLVVPLSFSSSFELSEDSQTFS